MALKLTIRMASNECPECRSHNTQNNEGTRYFENQIDYICNDCGCHWLIKKVVMDHGTKYMEI